MKAGKWLGTAAVLVLAGTAVIWINGRWPELSGPEQESAVTGTGETGTESQEDSGEQESAGRSSRESHGPLEPEIGRAHV